VGLKGAAMPPKNPELLYLSPMKIKDITSFLETLAPPAYQEDYDNAGLITSHENELTGVLVTLDCTEAVIEEAIARKCNLVVAHHPIVFKGLKKITGQNYVEKTVIRAIKNDIAIYAIHTNLDHVQQGVNKRIADILGLTNQRILSPKTGLLSKLYTYVPLANANEVRSALFEAGAGQIGNYDECSFNVEGTGTFRAGENTDAHVGKKYEQHLEKEVKIEVIFPNHLQKRVVAALKKTHPYEEVAYDIIKLSNEFEQVGAGMVGELFENAKIDAFLSMVKTRFNCGVIRYSGKTSGSIKKVAVCGGAGFFLLPAAKAAGADIFLTSDIKYHEFFDAGEELVLADMGHFESEQFTMDLLVEELKKKFITFAILKGNTNTNPVKYL
jgi:dinuclear metal center YbgI/SA1388 family protein